MKYYKIWSNKLNFSKKIKAVNLPEALDKISGFFGAIDYADFMQMQAWNSENGDGLHIEEI